MPEGGAEAIAAKILERFNDKVKVKGIDVNITVSVGIAYYGSGGESFNEVYASARKALTKAAESGVNKYEVYLDSN